MKPTPINIKNKRASFDYEFIDTDKNVSEIKLYTLEELTDMLNVTVYTLRNYVKSGKLKAAKIGGKWRVSEENLKKFVNGD